MDLEDFEFRPITDGLGFHKKTNSNNSAPANASAAQNELPSLDSDFDAESAARIESKRNILEKKVSEIPFDFKTNDNLFSQPLPRTERDVPAKQEFLSSDVSKASAVTAASASTAVDVPKFYAPRFSKPKAKGVIQQEVDLNAILDKVQVEDKPTQEQLKMKLEITGPSLLSMFLDFTMITGLSILFMLALVAVTHVEIVPIFNNISSDRGTQVGLVMLVYSVAQLYLVLARSFFGQTLGEWSLDTQLGTNEQQLELSYSFKLILRSLLLTVTGMIVLPIISLALNQDVTGKLVKLSLYRQK